MSNSELKETLIVIGRGEGFHRRDTLMLLDSLDRLQEISRNLAQAIYDADKKVNENEY